MRPTHRKARDVGLVTLRGVFEPRFQRGDSRWSAAVAHGRHPAPAEDLGLLEVPAPRLDGVESRRHLSSAERNARHRDQLTGN
jgi:hypothetical protein